MTQDQELLDAELELKSARAAKADNIYDIAIKVHRTDPKTEIGAAVKLRLLCDPDMGVSAGEPSEDDLTSLRQLLEFAEARAADYSAFLEAFEKHKVEYAATPDPKDEQLLALIAERDRLEAQAEAESDETIGEEAYNALTTRIGVEIGKLDNQIAHLVARTVNGIVGQLGVLQKLHDGPFGAEDEDHDGDCFDHLVISIAAGVRRWHGGAA